MEPRQIVKVGYDAIAATLPVLPETSEAAQVLPELVQRLPDGAQVLDVGCGSGEPVARLLSQHFHVTGLDLSMSQLRLARKSVPQAHFVLGDMTNLPFRAGSFDAICSYYAIIHVPREKHRGLLLDFHRLLRRSGVMLLCLGAGDLEDGIDEDWYGAPMYWSHYDAATNLEMLEACGFKLIWSKMVPDSFDAEAIHLFVVVEKS